MVGWGGEDDVMTHKIKTILKKYKKVDLKIHHLYHLAESVNDNAYRNNIKILMDVESMGKYELLEYYKDRIIGTEKR